MQFRRSHLLVELLHCQRLRVAWVLIFLLLPSRSEERCSRSALQSSEEACVVGNLEGTLDAAPDAALLQRSTSPSSVVLKEAASDVDFVDSQASAMDSKPRRKKKGGNRHTVKKDFRARKSNSITKWALLFLLMSIACCFLGCGVCVGYFFLHRRTPEGDQSDGQSADNADSQDNFLEDNEWTEPRKLSGSSYSSVLAAMLYAETADWFSLGRWRRCQLVLAPFVLALVSFGLAYITLYFMHQFNIATRDDFEGALNVACREFDQTEINRIIEALGRKNTSASNSMKKFFDKHKYKQKMISCLPPELLWHYLEDHGNLLRDYNRTDNDTVRVATFDEDSREIAETVSQLFKEERRQIYTKMVTFAHNLNETYGFGNFAKMYPGMVKEDKDSFDQDVGSFDKQIKPFLDTCMLMDKQLCGNAMCRVKDPRNFTPFYFSNFTTPEGSTKLPLKAAALWQVKLDLGSPVHVCNEVTDKICPLFLTENYTHWMKKRSDVCGQADLTMKHRGMQDIPVAQFHADKIFFGDTVGREKTPFRMILVGMLILFASRITQEFLEVSKWAVLLGIGSPVWIGAKKSVAGVQPEQLPIGRVAKVTFGMILFFQIALACTTLWIGFTFLLNTHDYMDLVLNSLALVFILEIDDMLFEAFAPAPLATLQRNIEVKPELDKTGVDRLKRYEIGSTALVFLCLLVVFIVKAAPYLVSGGTRWYKQPSAEQVSCFCQMEGENCLANHLFGAMEVHGPGLSGLEVKLKTENDLCKDSY